MTSVTVNSQATLCSYSKNQKKQKSKQKQSHSTVPLNCGYRNTPPYAQIPIMTTMAVSAICASGQYIHHQMPEIRHPINPPTAHNNPPAPILLRGECVSTAAQHIKPQYRSPSPPPKYARVQAKAVSMAAVNGKSA